MVEVVTGAEEEEEVATAEVATVEAMEVGWVAVVMAGEAMEAGSAEVMEEG